MRPLFQRESIAMTVNKVAIGLSMLLAAFSVAQAGTASGVDNAAERAREMNAFPVTEPYNPAHRPTCYSVAVGEWSFANDAANRPQLLTLFQVWSTVSMTRDSQTVPAHPMGVYYPDLASFTQAHPDRLNHENGGGIAIGCYKTEAEARSVQTILNDTQIDALRHPARQP
jgi:hypothetical protein